MNKFQCIGRVCREVVSGTTQKGDTYKRFTLAISTGNGNSQFITCYAYGKMSKPVSYLKNGSLVYLSGFLSIDRKKKTVDNKDIWTEYHRFTIQELEFFPRAENNSKDEDFEKASSSGFTPDTCIPEEEFEDIPF